MSFMRHILIFVIAILLLTSCGSKTHLELLGQEEFSLKSSKTYESYLALEYLVFARKLKSIKQDKLSKHFAKKGLDLINNKRVYPESPIKWDADILQIEGMIIMQKRLEEALSYPLIKYHLPIQSAHLTYLYDCWITRESKKVFRGSDIAKCRIRFSRLIDEVEGYIANLGKDKSKRAKIIAPKFSKYVINFDFNSYQINENGITQIIEVLRHLSQLNGDYKILIVGNADRSGKKIYNQSLAFKRANNVKRYLIKNGIDKELVDFRSYGESFPDLITDDKMQSQFNRTAEIFIIENYNDILPLPLPLIKNEIYKKEIIEARQKRGL